MTTVSPVSSCSKIASLVAGRTSMRLCLKRVSIPFRSTTLRSVTAYFSTP